MQILEYNPLFSAEIEHFSHKPKNHSTPDDFKAFNINEVILEHHLEEKIKRDYLTEFLSFREFYFISFPDNIYILGLNLLIDSSIRLNVEDFIELLSNNLKELLRNESNDGSSEFFDSLCYKFLGTPYTMLVIQEMQTLLERIRGVEEFRLFIMDPMNFKERKLCEILMKILSYEKISNNFKKDVELRKSKAKIEDYLLSEYKSLLDFESKFIREAFCESFSIYMQILLLDNDSEFKFIESSPENLDFDRKLEKNLVIFNDSHFKIYYLEKIKGKIPTQALNFEPIPEHLSNNKEPIRNHNKQDNMSLSMHTEPIIKEKDTLFHKQKAPSLQIPTEIPHPPLKTLCIKCAGQVIIDDYNRFSIYFLEDCETCKKKICSVHKDHFKKCACFCKKCMSRMEKRYHFKRSADFGFGDECYEIIECKKCKTMKCLYCAKKMNNYEDFCDCQCTVCAKKILNKFETGQISLKKCKECQMVCKKCMVKTLYGRKCDNCGENYCRVCFNEIMVAGKMKKEEEGKKNGKIKGKEEGGRVVCGFCEENKRNVGKPQKEKSFFDKIFN